MQSTGTPEARFRPVFSHLGAIRVYARRRGSLDADALAAEVMTIAWRRLADVPEDDPRPWLYATARPGATWPRLSFGPANSVTGRGAGGGIAVLNAQNAWECYWVRTIRTGDMTAQARAHAALDNLLAHNIIEAPAGADENWMPANRPNVPLAAFAHDGGLDSIRANYAAAAAGHPRGLAQSCYANAPGTIPGK